MTNAAPSPPGQLPQFHNYRCSMRARVSPPSQFKFGSIPPWFGRRGREFRRYSPINRETADVLFPDRQRRTEDRFGQALWEHRCAPYASQCSPPFLPDELPNINLITDNGLRICLHTFIFAGSSSPSDWGYEVAQAKYSGATWSYFECFKKSLMNRL